MKIFFINPPNMVPKDSNDPINVFQPMGLAYIAAILEKNGYEISILDALAEGWKRERVEGRFKFYGLTYDEIGMRIKACSPDIVGITNLSTAQIHCAFEVANMTKKIDKNIITVIGGHHPTANPEHCLSNPNVDFVVVGEGEYTFLDLVQRMDSQKELDPIKVKGIAYKSNGEIIKTLPRPFIKELDSLPFPARHLLPMNEYFESAKFIRSARSGSTFGKRWATLITSRGCPFKCVFCSIHAVAGRKWRARSPENVVDEIENLVRTYNIEQFDIEDDNFTLDKKRVERLCDLIIERRLDIEWSTPNGIRADTLDENLIIKMKKAGCKRICVAPESGDQRVVNNIIEKKLDLKKVENVVKLCRKHGIIVRAFFVMGFIGETIENIKTSITFAKKLINMGADHCDFFVAIPFYGTDLYKQAEKMGYFKNISNPEVWFGKLPPIETPNFTAREISQLHKLANKVNPLIPKYALKLFSLMMIKDPKRALRYMFERIK